MPELNESKMILDAQRRAKENNYPLLIDDPSLYVRFRLSAGIVIPHDEILDWDRRTFEASYPDREFKERPSWNCMAKMNAKYRQLTGYWDAMHFTIVEVAYGSKGNDMMFIMATRRGEWINKNGMWAVEYVFDPELQFPPMPEKEEKAREFLTKHMGFEKLGDYVTIYEDR
ncbi:hypothetical protein CYLTODRAFT_445232 [Cylindrobasidium torrendii FP15055 ss-10]|uniref:Uncharacterized protein n=1 Tax=Cylindrobasidium torrendii FP15055 ss-10 TaxID=1314674 RepID=A0A0D7B557_9AGAR|nr:hypothetical protein CYLTODRAFT_445232 [Cylindrobasidium torrendii FP15055 ss-10]